MQTVLKYLGMAKYVIPVIDAVIAEVETAAPTEKADIMAAIADVKKTWTDSKAAIETLITAVKAAIA